MHQLDFVGLTRRCAWCNVWFAQTCAEHFVCGKACAKAFWSWHLERHNGDWKLGLTNSPPEPLDMVGKQGQCSYMKNKVATNLNLPLHDRARLERLVEETGEKRVRLVGRALQVYELCGFYKPPRTYPHLAAALESEDTQTQRTATLIMVVDTDGTVEAFGG